jgi:predicted phage terminase large subunit-like protein
MQRLHEDDLAGYLLDTQPGRWTELSLPSIAEQDETIAIGHGKIHVRKKGDLLEPIRLSQTVLDEQRAIMGSAIFSSQYQQSPLPADGTMLKRKWVKSYTSLPDRSQGKIMQSWDTAMKGNVSADYSVCTTWLEVRGDHYLIDVGREQLEFPDLLKRALEQFHRHRPDGVLIEDRVSGTSLVQHLRRNSGIPIIDRRPDREKKVRFEKTMPLFESGRVYFPSDAPWLADLLKELLGFPSSKYDDQVDSVSQYLGWAIERGAHSLFEFDFFLYEGDSTPWDIANRLI